MPTFGAVKVPAATGNDPCQDYSLHDCDNVAECYSEQPVIFNVDVQPVMLTYHRINPEIPEENVKKKLMNVHWVHMNVIQMRIV